MAVLWTGSPHLAISQSEMTGYFRRLISAAFAVMLLSADGEDLRVFPSTEFRPAGSDQGKLVLTNGEARVEAVKGAPWSGAAFRAKRPMSLLGRREIVARVRNREDRPITLVLQAKSPGSRITSCRVRSRWVRKSRETCAHKSRPGITPCRRGSDLAGNVRI